MSLMISDLLPSTSSSERALILRCKALFSRCGILLEMGGHARITFCLNTHVFFDDDSPTKGLEVDNFQTSKLLALTSNLLREGWDVTLGEVHKGDFAFRAEKRFPDKAAAVLSRKLAEAEEWEIWWQPDEQEAWEEIIESIQTK
jgi:hypothetical protein